MAMRIMFVPCHIGGYAHFIPLLALYQQLEGASYETAFFLNAHARQYYAPYYQRMGIRVLDTTDDGSLQAAITAHDAFRPDVVVDDFSLSAGFLCQRKGTPRVALQRTGIFPGYQPRNAAHKHSSAVAHDRFGDVTALGFRPLASLSDLFVAAAHIVPGIASIEQVPAAAAGQGNYFFSGPLLLPDMPVDPALHNFMERHAACRKVYLTYGSVQHPPAEMQDGIAYLLQQGLAVISNVTPPPLSPAQQDRFYHGTYLPMHYVCSHTDIAIHHCGSATYHYPLLHGQQVLTLGTGCFDRDDVAMRLQELGVAGYLPAPEECADFTGSFKAAVARMLACSNKELEQGKQLQAALVAEIAHTQQAFQFKQVLRHALSQPAANNDTPFFIH